ncbi:MAG: hypothetical protein AMS25_02375 [Gemmatimonas sp. SM23_52]|nr:MAG: hypothetical protein AMS25_02375 [Gemmatimonas sp. SM23_52]
MNSTEISSAPKGQAAALKLWVVLARAYAAIEEQAAHHVAEHGLTLAEFGILEALYHKGPMLLCELQRKILVSSGGITYLVDRLEAEKLVRRRPSAEDRRARYVELTGQGQRLIQRVFPEHARRLSEVLSALSGREQRQAAALLRKLGRQAAGLE